MSWDLSRRVFLKGAGLLAVGMGGLPSEVIVRTARAASNKKKVFVHVFLRGGADGLNLVVPHGDPLYYEHRREIALPRPGKPGGVIRLDDHFGFHPALLPLEPLYKDGRLLAVHAVGNYGVSRSHFSAQDFTELGTPGDRGTKTGTLARLEGNVEGSGVLKSVSFSAQRPLSFLGPEPALVTLGIESFNLGVVGWGDECERRLRSMYAPSALAPTAEQVFSAVQSLRTPSLKDKPGAGAAYPLASPGPALQQAARIIQAGLGTSCFFVPVGGRFDTHSNQLEPNATEYDILARSLLAFAKDLGTGLDDVLVLVTTEFGRTVFVNGSHGTDHGSAFCALVMGGGVKGGRVLGKWPGLAKSALYEERDLAVTTDFRDLYSELVQGHLGVGASAKLFPGFTPGAPIGLFS